MNPSFSLKSFMLQTAKRRGMTPTLEALLAVIEQRERGELTHEEYVKTLERLECDGFIADSAKPSLLPKSTAELYCRFVLESLAARRSGGRQREATEDERAAGVTFRAWHAAEHKRVRDAIHSVETMSRQRDLARLKALVCVLEALQAAYEELEVLWWPTTIRVAGRNGGLIELCAAWRTSLDNSLLREGAYEQVALPVSRDELPF